MLVRTWLAPLAVLLSACGPEAEVVPRSGVYDVTSEIVANDCTRAFDDTQSMDAIVFEDEQLRLGFADFLFPNSAVGWLGSRVYPLVERAPDGEGFVAPPDESFFDWFELRGCRYRRGITVDALAGDVIRSSVTYEWTDAGACTWLDAPQTGCTMVREYTYTLREACAGCDFHEVMDRLDALYAELNALPK
jgi:hypothetical protein